MLGNKFSYSLQTGPRDSAGLGGDSTVLRLKLTTLLLLAPSFRMCGAIPQLHHTSSRCGTSLVTRAALPPSPSLAVSPGLSDLLQVCQQ